MTLMEAGYIDMAKGDFVKGYGRKVAMVNHACDFREAGRSVNHEEATSKLEN